MTRARIYASEVTTGDCLDEGGQQRVEATDTLPTGQVSLWVRNHDSSILSIVTHRSNDPVTVWRGGGIDGE